MSSLVISRVSPHGTVTVSGWGPAKVSESVVVPASAYPPAPSASAAMQHEIVLSTLCFIVVIPF